jgi:glycosyltransferase involved in cell wall biosynthesis
MKILQVVPAYYPAEAYGGSVRLAHDLSVELVRKGHQVTVYTSDTLDKASRHKEKCVEINGVRVHYFRNISNYLAWHRLIFNPGIIARINKEGHSFDVFQLHGMRNFGNIVAYEYAIKHNVPYFLLTAGSVLPIGGKLKLKAVFDRLYGRRILRDAARVIVCNTNEIEEHKKMGADAQNIINIPPSYDIRPFAELPAYGLFREKFGLQGKKVVIFMGRINAIKGIEFLIKSFAKLAPTNQNAVLVIVGPDDGYKVVLESLTKELGLIDRISFTGFLGGADKRSALLDADLLVQTSLFERGPGSPFEAVLCNTPIIVTRNTGAGELVAQVDAGYLVDYGDENQLTGLMQHILEDPGEARAKALKARQYIIDNLSWEKLIVQYEELYQSVIKARAHK